MTRQKSIKISGYDGEVVVRPMRNIEKFDMMQALGMTPEKLTSLARKKKVTAKDMNLDLNTMKSMFAKASELIVSIDLKKDDLHFQSWDDLDFDPAGLPIQMELMNYTLGVGK